MKNEDRKVELLAEMVKGQDRLTGEVSEMKNQTLKLNLGVDSLNSRVDKLNSEVVKLNLSTSENSRAIMKIADEIRLVAEHEKRISKLESTVFK